MKKSNQKSNKKATHQQPMPFSVYGARLSASGNYVNITLVQGEDDDKTYRNALVKVKGKYIGVKLKDDSVILTIPRLDAEDEEEEEEEGEEKPLSDKKPVRDEDLPF